tara:strand:- start:118 stop:219 length:102 start_codon:yes stop_codon:yes gene_type:complete
MMSFGHFFIPLKPLVKKQMQPAQAEKQQPQQQW